jgi:hypothetical protein
MLNLYTNSNGVTVFDFVHKEELDILYGYIENNNYSFIY